MTVSGKELSTSASSGGDAYPFPVRGGEPKDVAYILSSWKRSYVNSPPTAWVTRGYFSRMNKVCAEIMQHAKAIVAVDPTAKDYILAWAVYSDKALHYCFTKSEYRRLGLMRYLLANHLPASVIYYSHITEDGGRLAAEMGLQYKPSEAYPKTDALYWEPAKQEKNAKSKTVEVSYTTHNQQQG